MFRGKRVLILFAIAFLLLFVSSVSGVAQATGSGGAATSPGGSSVGQNPSAMPRSGVTSGTTQPGTTQSGTTQPNATQPGVIPPDSNPNRRTSSEFDGSEHQPEFHIAKSESEYGS